MSSGQEFTSTPGKSVTILTAAGVWISSCEWTPGCLQTEPSKCAKMLRTMWNLWCLLLWHDRHIWTTCICMAWQLCVSCRGDKKSHCDKRTVPGWMCFPPLVTCPLLFFPWLNQLAIFLRWELPLAEVCAKLSLFVVISLVWTIWCYCDIDNKLFTDKQRRSFLGLISLGLYTNSRIISQVSSPSNRIWSHQQLPQLLTHENNIRKTFTVSFSLI